MNQKLFRFEVDQSIRVEELSGDTIVALANTERKFTVILTAKVKKRLYERFRCLGQPKRFAPKVFSALIIFIIKNSGLKFTELVIDIEYPGYEILITNCLSKYFPELLVYFSVIGKKSPAHYAAYGVHTKKSMADVAVTLKEILKLI